MKYLIIIFLVVCKVCTAQDENQPVKLEQYVFDEFSPGQVKMKSGEHINQSLNYNIVTNEMIFDNNGKYMAIAQPELVDTVYIKGQKFVPRSDKFYEVLLNGDHPLLMEFSCVIHEPGTPSGYGGTSSTTAASNLKSLISVGGAYNLKLPDGYTVIPKYNFWIQQNGELEKAGNEKQFDRIFPAKKELIKKIVKEQNINFSRRKDVLTLVRALEEQ